MPMFNKRHYEAIATVMQETKPPPNWGAHKLAPMGANPLASCPNVHVRQSSVQARPL
jgi:hypothetical protein